MVAIPLIWSGRRRTGLLERLMAWIGDDVTADPKPGKPARQMQPAPRRPEFLEHAAMSRELHRL